MRTTHASLLPVSMKIRTCEFDPNAYTLCGRRVVDLHLPAVSTRKRWVTCPDCRAHSDFELLSEVAS